MSDITSALRSVARINQSRYPSGLPIANTPLTMNNKLYTARARG